MNNTPYAYLLFLVFGAKLRISGETDCLKTALGVAKRPWKVLQKRRMVLQNSAKGAA
jgi:CO/xanthine dehydrogenase Mo-binding subunit